MPHHLKTQSLVLRVLFFIAMLSSVVSSAPTTLGESPTFMKSTVSKCNRLNCSTTISNGTPAGATSGDDSLVENTELQVSHELLPTKKGVSTDLNLSGNDQLTDVVSLEAGSTEIGMKVTTGDVLPAVFGTDSKRIAKSTHVNVGLPTETASDDTIPVRAMCQWVYNTNINELRRPKVMQFAELKDGASAPCIDSAGKSVTDNHCELVYYKVQVQRRVNNDWVSDLYEDVPVAGVCVKSKL